MRIGTTGSDTCLLELQRGCTGPHEAEVKVVRDSQSEAESIAVALRSFQCSFIVGPGKANTWGLNERFDEDATRLYRSMVSYSLPGKQGDLLKVVSEDL